jgi:hypothetical protein
MIDAATAAALRDITPRQSRPYRTFLEDLARVRAMLAPLGRDGLISIGRTGSSLRGRRDSHGSAPMPSMRLPFGRKPRTWEDELRRVVAFTGRQCLP